MLETKHQDFVEAADEVLRTSPVPGTPAMAIDGALITSDRPELFTDRSRLHRHLRKAAGATA
ncbi:hypothetical protein ACFWB2_19475 [Streptomyces virginiae]|uniref:hypothetical protein n=1 Tax=Streptomyces virginiae TaxID=1961 RepID=UPI002DD83F49|nr:hypothetical protein [Streptomyces virginiae]WSC75298.1 hypothetical protein OHA56_02555 [Streptomyces virginiae]